MEHDLEDGPGGEATDIQEKQPGGRAIDIGHRRRALGSGNDIEGSGSE